MLPGHAVDDYLRTHSCKKYSLQAPTSLTPVCAGTTSHLLSFARENFPRLLQLVAPSESQPNYPTTALRVILVSARLLPFPREGSQSRRRPQRVSLLSRSAAALICVRMEPRPPHPLHPSSRACHPFMRCSRTSWRCTTCTSPGALNSCWRGVVVGHGIYGLLGPTLV